MGGSRGSTVVWAVSLTDVRVLQNTLCTVPAILVEILSNPTEHVLVLYGYNTAFSEVDRKPFRNDLGMIKFPNSEEYLRSTYKYTDICKVLSYQAFLTDLT